MAGGPKFAPLPLIDLEGGAQVVFEAIDPSTGATVAGVEITEATIYATGGDGASSDLAPLEPVYLLPSGN